MPEAPDYADAALDIYGDAATAAEKLQAHLDRADELEIDERTRRDCAALVHDLRKRAEATSDPALQRTKHVETLIGQMRRRRNLEQARERAEAAASAAEAHTDMPELRRLIDEHRARNAERGILNDSGYALPSVLEEPVVSPLNFKPEWSRFAGRKNTLHNGAIRALQKRIAESLRVWNRREKRADLAMNYEYLSEAHRYRNAA